MKRTSTIALAIIGLSLVGPLAAHHNSADPEFVEDHVLNPAALDQHNAVVDDVLDMGNASMAGTTMDDQMQRGGTSMDPADMGDYGGPGSDDSDPSATRSPPTVE